MQEVNSHKRLRTHEVQETQAVVAQKAWESVSLEDGYALETRLEGQCIHPGAPAPSPFTLCFAFVTV